MLEIDGSLGEGGGQILRSAVALSMLTGTSVAIGKIRARRRKPGLVRQHLTAVQAAARISNARLSGDRVGSTALEFEPRRIQAGDYRLAIGTAGSTTLVLQTVLPALLTAAGPSSLVLEGGTHNLMAPPFPFLADTFLPVVNRMGPEVTATLDRPGFYPAGGGRLRVGVRPCERLAGLEIHDRGKIRVRRATALVARLPRHIGERELRHVRKQLGWAASELHLEVIEDSAGPGNVLFLQLGSDALTETFTGFGEVGVRAGARLGYQVSVMTSGYWATSDSKTRRLLLELQDLGLDRIGVSFDRFHLAYIGEEPCRRIAVACEDLDLPMAIRAVVASGDRLGEELKASFRDTGVEVNVHSLVRLGRAADLPDEAFESCEAIPLGPCDTVTAAEVTPEGLVYACCGPGIFMHPYNPLVLGDTRRQSLSRILARGLANPLLKILNLRGPRGILELLEAEGCAKMIELRRRYYDACQLCMDICNRPGAVGALQRIFDRPEMRRELEAAQLRKLVREACRLRQEASAAITETLPA